MLKTAKIFQVIRFINTVRYLRFVQIYYRFLRKFKQPIVSEILLDPPPLRPPNWIHVKLHQEKIDVNLNARFLNKQKKLDLPLVWTDESEDLLWRYNLHYFDDLVADTSEDKREVQRQLLYSWIGANPPGFGVAWEPYPTSLRIVNILKAWMGGLDLDDVVFNSLYSQASYLSNNLERHLLGNHYFTNLKALFFAGVIFSNSRWCNIAFEGLCAEIPEQVLADGANFELSPMYHSLMLVDMLDMYNLSRAYPKRCPDELIALIVSKIPKMLEFLGLMSHPDGGVSFFNDSVDGISPQKSCIEDYALSLGFIIPKLYKESVQLMDARHSGYFCATVSGNKLIFDAGQVGPDYIPGHAHADTLSFELSIGSQRVFVNSGISEYGLSRKRHNQRKTAAHNTVEVNGTDSSEVWSSFRVGKRARLVNRQGSISSSDMIVMTASHDGYKTRCAGCVHTRELKLTEGSLTVSDSLDGKFKFATAYFYFHPNLKVDLSDGVLEIKSSKFSMQSDLSGRIVSLSDSFWHPEFGVEIPNKVLKVEFIGRELEIEFSWVVE